VDFIIDLTQQDPSADVLKRVLDVQGEWRSKGSSVVLLIEEEQQRKIDSSLEIAMAPNATGSPGSDRNGADREIT
jgi:hypothetical protein